ncbi:hypothetical protein AAHA92_20671 [Salvia divinorum]|uniref:DUF7912 domain-containing protein n=1 Tax=Salvia divinorum TaxID=28513 RepID=A0ABD1GIA8_SALDI
MKAITLNCHAHHCARLRSAVPIISPAMRFITSSFPFYPSPLRNIPQRPLVAFAKKKNSNSEPVLSPSITEEVYMDDDLEDDILLDDELLDDDTYFDDEYFEEEAEPSVGDGAGGGGISLAGTEWDKKAFKIAEEVCLSFDGELDIYAFRTQLNATIKVRIERLTNKSGSPDMTDIEAFTTAYRMRLDEAEATGDIPQNISLEVSSPGVERVVRVPQDLERFKDRNLYVKYVAEATDSGSSPEVDGVFRLISFDIETRCCTWGLADVRVNREKSGKGRPLSKKQKEWRLNTPLDSLRLVRLFSDM